MDETTRDIYNRFGDQYLDFDPRQDDLKLLSSVAATYLYWGILCYVTTMPKSCKLCSTWIMVVLIAMLVLEVFLCLTETNIPKFFPKYMTEYEFLLLLHCTFPFLMSVFRILAEYFFLDLDQCTINAFNELSKHQKVCTICILYCLFFYT